MQGSFLKMVTLVGMIGIGIVAALEVNNRLKPDQDTSESDEELSQGLVAGYRAQGLLGGFVGLAATVLFFFNRRGLRPVDDEGADSEPPAQREH